MNMAICKVCGKDMLRAAGCRAPRIHIGGKNYRRIKVGDPGDFIEGGTNTRCPDCNALFDICTIMSQLLADLAFLFEFADDFAHNY